MRIVLIQFLLLMHSITGIAQPFITQWDLTNPGSGATQLSFGVGTSGPVSYSWETVPAGQNGSGIFAGTTALITGLPPASVIRLSIDTTNFHQIVMDLSPDTLRLMDIEQWGAVHWSNMQGAFSNCSNVDVSANDIPDLSAVLDMGAMFYKCSSLTGPGNINSWNTGNAIIMSAMFAYASSFNQPVGNWNTQNVLFMDWMFSHATSFNQPVGSWNTSNVNKMGKMFNGASSFNQPLDSFELDNVGLPFPGNDLEDMLSYSGLDCKNYSQTLYGWSNYPNVPGGLFLGADGLQFGQSAQAARNSLITNKGWSVYGDSLSNTSCCFSQWNTANINSCGNYNFNGQVLTTSGVYFDSLVSVYGCDSLVTLNLVINQSSAFSYNDTACSSYYFNGQTITSSGIYMDTLLNAQGCDSIITLSLTIHQPTSTTLNQSVCNSYFFNGQTLTNSGTYYDTLINTNGCDSIITLNLSINSNASSISDSACLSYFFNGQTLTSSGVYFDTLLNANGCDSIISLNLTIHPSTLHTLNQTACLSYVFNGQTYTSSGVYYDTLLNANGCDSIIVLNLTVNPDISVSQAGATLTSNAVGATFQWLSCNPFSVIFGVTGQSYTPTINGQYAVVVTQQGCVDTSACYSVQGLGMESNIDRVSLRMYPNPTSESVNIESGQNFRQASIRVLALSGEILFEYPNVNGSVFSLNVSHLSAGIYYLEILEAGGKITRKLVKQ